MTHKNSKEKIFNPLNPKTSFLQKIILISFGIVCCVILLEISLRLGGLVFSSLQQYRNYLSIKQKGAYRVLCLGESTTAGQYPHFLEKALNQRNIGIKFSVIDGGVVASNTWSILYRLKSNLDEYHPDMVITMMGINDGGEYIPYEAASHSQAINFWKSFRVYKLTRLLWLHIVTRLKELKPDNTTQPKFRQEDTSQPYTKNKAREAELGNAEVYIKQGELCRDQGRLSEAEAFFKKAVELNPKNDGPYFKLGDLYREQRRFSEAEAFFKKAVELNPKNEIAYVEVGWAYVRQGRLSELSEAEAFFKKAVELNPKNDWAYGNLGCFYRDQRRFSEAEAFFKKAVELNPKNDWAYTELGIAYRDQGKLSQAGASFKKTIELNPKYDKAYFFLGWVYLCQGKLFKAEALFKKAVELNPKNDWAYGALRVLYIEMGNSRLAREYDNKAKELRLSYYPPMIIGNYRRLKATLDKRGIVFVCMQYPMRSPEPLQRIFKDRDQGIIFVDNEKVFKDAVAKDGYKTYFMDMFAGDFGHCAEKGNRLLAENIANVILKEVFGK